MQLSKTLTIGMPLPNKVGEDCGHKYAEKPKGANCSPPCERGRNQSNGNTQLRHREDDGNYTGQPCRDTEILNCLARSLAIGKLRNTSHGKDSRQRQPRSQQNKIHRFYPPNPDELLAIWPLAHRLQAEQDIISGVRIRVGETRIISAANQPPPIPNRT
jgi:hypothetical protein